MTDVIDLTVPVKSDLLILARLTAATLASRADFGIDEIEDLRLVTEELCLSMIGRASGGVVRLRFIRDDSVITIECSHQPDSSNGVAPEDPDEPDEFSQRIIEALVDEFGSEQVDGHTQGWIRKRRGRVAS